MVTLHDIMSVDVITISPETTLREVAELLSDEHITGLPVVAGDEVVGVVSATDLLSFDAESRGVPGLRPERGVERGAAEPDEWREGEAPLPAYFVDLWENAGADVRERFESTGSPEWDVLEEHTAGEIMTRSVVSLPPATEAQEAARYMLRTGVRRVLVMEDGRLVGVATTTDMLKAVAQHGLAG